MKSFSQEEKELLKRFNAYIIALVYQEVAEGVSKNAVYHPAGVLAESMKKKGLGKGRPC